MERRWLVQGLLEWPLLVLGWLEGLLEQPLLVLGWAQGTAPEVLPGSGASSFK